MNTTAVSLNSSELSWNLRRCSTETTLSIQGRETDCARDTSDTEPVSDGEYEPLTEPEDDAPLDDDGSAESDNIISTKVIEVCVRSDGDLVFADSERTSDTQSDSDIDYHDYSQCAQCGADNQDVIYRYCHKCFQVRKSFFPPRPRRKRKRSRPTDFNLPPSRSEALTSVDAPTKALSQDSGVDFTSQGTSQDSDHCNTQKRRSGSLDRKSKRPKYTDENASESDTNKKRRAGSFDRSAKRAKYSDDNSDTNVEDVIPLSKCASDPSVSIESVKVTKKVIAETLKEIETKELCIVCVSEPKSGVFVHGRLAHICCCYKCAVRVWTQTKRCPICKRKISNVLRAVVM